MAVAHEGLASLAVDLHEVGDLLALTNSLVQLHNLVGGSQVTPSQSRRHHSPRSNKWCVDDELLALVLQMIVSLWCQNRRILGRGSRTVRLRLMVIGGRGHEVLPRFRPS